MGYLGDAAPFVKEAVAFITSVSLLPDVLCLRFLKATSNCKIMSIFAKVHHHRAFWGKMSLKL